MRQVSMYLTTLIAVCCFTPRLHGEDSRPSGTNDNDKNLALLVGCTKYELSEIPDLDGPSNDVELLRTVLVERFGFKEDNVVTLSETAGRENGRLRPTYANIEREFEKLGIKAESGSQVVVLLSGHGFQQPDTLPPDPNDIEPDGLDETFAPADTRRGKDGKTLVNMIVDDQLRQWAQAISAKGASLCLIVDACHSGTVLRGSENEVARRLDAEELGLSDAYATARRKARSLASGERDANSQTSAFDALGDLKNIAAIYAAQSFELEVEQSFADPEDGGEPKPYGLLTYTLCQLLNTTNSSRPLTYRRLVQLIRLQYARMGRTFPTPIVEGDNADREVLGAKVLPRRIEYAMRRVGEKWTVDAGKIHGLTKGSILAVHSDDSEKPMGYAQVVSIRDLTCDVEPCAYRDAKPVAALPANGLCKPEVVYYDNLRLKLAAESIETTDQGVRRKPAPATVVEKLKTIAVEEGSLIEIAAADSPGCWRVQVEGDRLFLVPPQGVLVGQESVSPAFGPFAVDKIETELNERLQRLARATMLKQVARPPEAEAARRSSSVDVDIDIIKYESREDRQGRVVAASSNGLTFSEGQIIGFQVTNLSQRSSVYVTLLFIDSGYGVVSVYPGLGEIAERLKPGASFRTGRFSVSGDTVGMENLLAIAVRATGPPLDFTALEQPTIERARKIALTRSLDSGDPFESPLGKLLQYGIYGVGTTRGIRAIDIDEHVIDLLTWKTQPQSTNAQAKP